MADVKNTFPVLIAVCFSPRHVFRCVPAGHWGSGSSAAWRLEQLGAGGVLQHGAALSLPSAAECLQRASLHKLRGRISRLPGLHLHTARQHAGNDPETGATVTTTNATTNTAFPTATDTNYPNMKLTCCFVCVSAGWAGYSSAQPPGDHHIRGSAQRGSPLRPHRPDLRPALEPLTSDLKPLKNAQQNWNSFKRNEIWAWKHGRAKKSSNAEVS